jgi:hypothetical protein
LPGGARRRQEDEEEEYEEREREIGGHRCGLRVVGNRRGAERRKCLLAAAVR